MTTYAASSTGTPCHLTVVGFGGADELEGEPGVLGEDMVDAVEERRLEMAQAERVLLHQHHGAPDSALQHRGRRTRLTVVEGVQHGQAGSHEGEGSDAAIARGATSREETESDGTRERETK